LKNWKSNSKATDPRYAFPIHVVVSIGLKRLNRLHFYLQGVSAKDEEIDRLRAELISAAEEMEENARFLQRFQSLSSMAPGDSENADGFKRIIEQVDQLKRQLQENELQLTERDHQVTKNDPN